MKKTDLLVILAVLVVASRCELVIVSTNEAPPFASMKSGTLQGFSVDLWNMIAATALPPIVYNWTVIPTANSLALLKGLVATPPVADVTISSISITSTRQQFVQFSPSMFSSGLSVMIHYSSDKPSSGLLAMKSIFSPLLWQELGVLLVAIFLAAHIYYFLERRKKGEPSSVRPSYNRGGLEDSIWWAGSVMTSMGSDIAPMSLAGRVFNLLVFLFSFILIAIIGATITASLTITSLNTSTAITGIKDLGGKTVAVVNTSTADVYMSDLGIAKLDEFPSIQAMFNQFDLGESSSGLDAVVYDQPILLYHTETSGKGTSKVVGGIVQPQDYGIGFPPNSPYYTRVNVALLTLQENGKYDDLYKKWFGDAAQSSSAEINILTPDNAILGATYGALGLCTLLVAIMFIVNSRRRAIRKSANESTPSTSKILARKDEAENDDTERVLGDLQRIKGAIAIVEQRITEARLE